MILTGAYPAKTPPTSSAVHPGLTNSLGSKTFQRIPGVISKMFVIRKILRMRKMTLFCTPELKSTNWFFLSKARLHLWNSHLHAESCVPRVACTHVKAVF